MERNCDDLIWEVNMVYNIHEREWYWGRGLKRITKEKPG